MRQYEDSSPGVEIHRSNGGIYKEQVYSRSNSNSPKDFSNYTPGVLYEFKGSFEFIPDSGSKTKDSSKPKDSPKPISKIPVRSSNVKTICYFDDTCILEVEFRSGSTYQYANVSLEVFEQFKSSNSKGGFLCDYIKGRYNYSQV